MLDLVTQLGRFCNDYTTLTSKRRYLLNKNANFSWTEAHKAEFDSVIKTLSSLEYLIPYNPGNQIFSLTDVYLHDLEFILFQKDSTGHVSILLVGSTCLKNAQIRWNPS